MLKYSHVNSILIIFHGNNLIINACMVKGKQIFTGVFNEEKCFGFVDDCRIECVRLFGKIVYGGNSRYRFRRFREEVR